MINLDKLDYLHIWLGTYNGSASDYQNLFDLSSFYEGYENDDFERCEFSSYLNTDAYSDEIVGWNYSKEGLNHLLSELPGQKLIEKVKEIAIAKSLNNSNAVIYYGAHHLESLEGLSKNFVDLEYIGEIKGFE